MVLLWEIRELKRLQKCSSTCRPKSIGLRHRECLYSLCPRSSPSKSHRDVRGTMFYERYVMPANRIIDYNTEFSGITRQTHKNPISMEQVHRELKDITFEDTIYVGHDLQHDFRGLKVRKNSSYSVAQTIPAILDYTNSLIIRTIFMTCHTLSYLCRIFRER